MASMVPAAYSAARADTLRPCDGLTRPWSAGASMTEAASSQARTPARPKWVRVPDVTAYYDYYAEDALINRGFEVRFVYDYQDGFAPRGVTWATDPSAGTLARRGSTVTVYATPKDLPLPRRLR